MKVFFLAGAEEMCFIVTDSRAASGDSRGLESEVELGEILHC